MYWLRERRLLDKVQEKALEINSRAFYTCGWPDLNRHGIDTEGFKVPCVCLFHHTRISTHRYFFARATAENEDLYVRCTDVLKLYFNGTLVGEGGFEPPKLLAADLQSVPFGHSGIRPDIA